MACAESKNTLNTSKLLCKLNQKYSPGLTGKSAYILEQYWTPLRSAFRTTFFRHTYTKNGSQLICVSISSIILSWGRWCLGLLRSSKLNMVQEKNPVLMQKWSKYYYFYHSKQQKPSYKVTKVCPIHNLLQQNWIWSSPRSLGPLRLQHGSRKRGITSSRTWSGSGMSWEIFSPYKSIGPNGIYLSVLSQRAYVIVRPLSIILQKVMEKRRGLQRLEKGIIIKKGTLSLGKSCCNSS